MRNKLNTPRCKRIVARLVAKPKRAVMYSVIFGGLFLSTSQIMGIANGAPLPVKAEKPTAFHLPFNKVIKSHFIRDIRAAIAARWQASQLHTLVDALVNNQPEQPGVAKPADQDSGSSFKPFVGTSLLYDDNLLRIAKSTNGATVQSKSDFIKQIRAGIAARWAINKQVLLAKAVVSQYWFSTYTELDYLERNIQASWNWQLGKYLTGIIGYSNITTRGDFGQLNGLINNLQTTSQYFTSAEYQLTNDWFLQGGFTLNNSSSSSSLLRNNNSTENIGTFGIKYQTLNNNMLGFRTNIIAGSFPDRPYKIGDYQDNAYMRYDYNIEWAWQYSVKTKLNGHVGYTQQFHEHLAERNFSEPTATVNLQWTPSSKTILSLYAWRNIQFSNRQQASFVVSQGLRFMPGWLITPKLQLSLPMSYEQQEYLGNPSNIASTHTEKDDISKLGLTLDYNPVRNSKISFLMQLEDRVSTELTRNYQSKSIGLDMQYDF